MRKKKSRWKGWVWCTNQMGQSGWVPKRCVQRREEIWVALCSYEAKELSVRVAEELIVLREESGWFWCIDERGQKGWVPAENVEKLPEPEGSETSAESECDFCKMEGERIIRENELAIAIRDGFPVTPLHTLIIPKRHVTGHFDLRRPEVEACHQLLVDIQDEILSLDDRVKGFNIGINQGVAAGQTIEHCHIHLIPRREGDCDHPRGGVRHVMPGKGDYQIDRNDST